MARVEPRPRRWCWSVMSLGKWPVAMGKGFYSSGRRRGRLDVDQTKEKGRLYGAHRNGGDGGHGGPNVCERARLR
jgi:hypothetical protein